MRVALVVVVVEVVVVDDVVALVLVVVVVVVVVVLVVVVDAVSDVFSIKSHGRSPCSTLQVGIAQSSTFFCLFSSVILIR